MLTNKQVIGILSDTLSQVDPRLINHGKRVAYLVFKILEPEGRFDDKTLRDICLAALLHDVGAYKTEEIDAMMVFETVDIWEHSIYGYLFLKHLSPLKELSQVVLFHHAECRHISNLSPDHALLSQLISLADSVDIHTVFGRSTLEFRRNLEKWRDTYYTSEVVDLFLESGLNLSEIFNHMSHDEEFNRILYDVPLTADEVNAYINMVAYSIDFRSSQTVIHTVATASVACMLASLSGADEKEISQVRTGAMLHDLGKVAIPLHILESPNRLSEDEMKIMREHVVISDNILKNNVGEPIKSIAVNHHEKLNGTGYPNKLDRNSLTVFHRIMAVADIFSALCGTRSYKDAYPKSRVVGILEKMADDDAIDSDIVSLAIQHYEDLIEAQKKEAEPVILAYRDIKTEYLYIHNQIGLCKHDSKGCSCKECTISKLYVKGGLR